MKYIEKVLEWFGSHPGLSIFLIAVMCVLADSV